MFEVTADDILQLNDKQLRELIALLCETEVRQKGYSTAAVTWGGDQNAKDGGLDVRVALPEDAVIGGYIPKRTTGFQVKCQNMAPAMIPEEMCPDSVLRASIRELADNDGAYIIISSQGSVADSALKARKQAMTLALGDLAKKIVVEFYDRTRLASWVGNHTGIILKIRTMIGRTIPGWEPFGAWAYPAGGVEAEYLFEKGIRIKQRPSQSDESYSAEEGVTRIRNILSQPKNIVRLIGLSGVGKTRFVQALFDARIGQDALDLSLAIYTNIGNEPNPPPFVMVSELIAQRKRAILVIDNCAPDLHARLIQHIQTIESQLSVITIEYDIRDDLPENTQVFEMQAASVELVERILAIRYPDLSQIDIQTAAEFSGGNSRIGIALAGTVSHGGTLARLSNSEIFERLFYQRHGNDRALLRFARVCSLVYSFNGEDISSENEDELPFIARLAGVSVHDAMYYVAELMGRDLIQRRGKWRALLPHALANQLADDALKSIPKTSIDGFENGAAPIRLLTSFSRRLGYLDRSREASDIVARWLGKDGLIGSHIWNLNDTGKTILRNCLPACPEAGLKTLEQDIPDYSEDNPISMGEYLIKLVRLIAWDSRFFDRCIRILKTLAIHGDEKISGEATKAYTSLFALYLSGTHATLEQREKTARALLVSSDAREQELGVKCLDEMLKTSHFMSDYNFHFGAHSRDYGYQPKTWREQTAWYEAVLQLADDIIFSQENLSDSIKQALSKHFRGLWYSEHLRNRIESLWQKVVAQCFWPEGWASIKQTRRFDATDKNSESYRRLSALEEKLRPSDLIQSVRGKVLSKKNSYFDEEDVDLKDAKSFQLAMDARSEEVADLGAQVALDHQALQELMPEMVFQGGNLWFFGMGLARGSENPERLWLDLTRCLDQTSKEKRDVRALCGMLFELKNRSPELTSRLLDTALTTEPLAYYFPSLQGSVPLDENGLTRLLKSLTVRSAPISAYAGVQLGGWFENCSPELLQGYLIALARVPGGLNVAIELLSTKFFHDRQSQRSHSSALIDAGKEFLKIMNFAEDGEKNDYHLCRVLETCLRDNGSYGVARDVCERFVHAVVNRLISGFDHSDLIKTLFKVQPKAALDGFINEDYSTDGDDIAPAGVGVIDRAGLYQSDLLEQIDESVLFEWCESAPNTRYDLAGMIAPVFELEKGNNLVIRRQHTGWTPMAARLVHAAPDPVSVMEKFVQRLRPAVSSGSRSALLRRGIELLVQFDAAGDVRLTEFIAKAIEGLEMDARQNEEWELKFHRDREESFE